MNAFTISCNVYCLLVWRVCRFLVPVDGAEFQAVVAVAVGADDGVVGLVEGAFFVAGDDLGRGDVVAFMAPDAGGVDDVAGEHLVGGNGVVFVVAVGDGLAVASGAADHYGRVRGSEVLVSVVCVADKAR